MSDLKILTAMLVCTIGSAVLAQTGDSAAQNRNEVKPWPTTIKVVTVELQSDVTLPPQAGDQLRRYITGRNIDDSPDWVDELEESARDVFQHYGYFRASVRTGVRRLRGSELERNFALTFQVTAGRQYRLDDIHISGGKVFSPDVLRTWFSLSEGEIFDTHSLRAGMQALRDAYGLEGYINFVAVPSFQIDEGHSRISLRLEIEEGPQYRVGQVTILGPNEDVAEKLAQNSGLKTGVVYSTKLVADFIRDNPSIFPRYFLAEDDVERRINEDRNTVDLIFNVPGNEP
jgi:outer membrane protein assembly factor BamA